MSTKKPIPPAMILCDGQETRLRDVTGLQPKPLEQNGVSIQDRIAFVKGFEQTGFVQSVLSSTEEDVFNTI